MLICLYYFLKNFVYLEEIFWVEEGGFFDDEVVWFCKLGLLFILMSGVLLLFLGISFKMIFLICFCLEKYYCLFLLKKKDGIECEINIFWIYFKIIYWWILDNIFNYVEIVENVFGFVVG